MSYDFEVERAVLGPLLLRYNPLARVLLGEYDRYGAWLRSRGRRVALRRLEVGGRTINLLPAIVVLAADLGCPTLQAGASDSGRRGRRDVIAAAATLLALGLVDPPEDDPETT